MKEPSLLVVDDDSRYLNMIKTVSAEMGLKVRCAQGGEDAIKEVKEGRFDLIFTDLRMPGMDGLELARRVIEMSPETRIVITTGDPSPEVRALAKGIGISKVTAKPWNPEQIRDIIDGVGNE